jgi:GntR family transcriptional regulator
MLVTLDPRDERPLYLQIVDQVRRALLVGTLRAEDPFLRCGSSPGSW